MKAFKVYVRPILEYCSQAWSPHLVKDILLLESVQRKFTKRIKHMQNVPYLERLNKLGLERLDVRRLRADLVFTYKIIFGLISDIELALLFTLADIPHDTRGHRYKLSATRTKKDTARYFFSQRVINVWNNLPSSTDFMSLARFRNHLTNDYLVDYCAVIV